VAEGSPTLSHLGECAILIRVAALAAPIEKALRDHGIPYRFIGERPWWEEEPAKSVVDLLRDTTRRAEATFTGVKPASLQRGNERNEPHPAEAVRAAIELLNKPSTEPLLERLVDQASLYRDLSSFLDDLALGSPQDGYEASRDVVALMTIHAAKGLEFDYVFVPGLEDGILPFTLFEKRVDEDNNDDDRTGSDGHIEEKLLEEERRLLYVAMTRSRVGLSLSWARSRHFLGRTISLPPSRFLSDIEDLVPFVERSSPRRPHGPSKPRDFQPSLF